jgi:hypothetical protein
MRIRRLLRGVLAEYVFSFLTALGCAMSRLARAPRVACAEGARWLLPACGAATDMPSAFAAMRQGGGPGRRVISGNGPPVPAIIFHGNRDTTVHPNNGGQVLEQAIGTTSTPKSVHRGQIPGGHAYTRTTHTDAGGREIWNTGISTAPATHGREAALRAPTLIRKDRTQRGKCCVSSSGIRCHTSSLELVGSRHECEVPTKSLLLFEPQRLRVSSFNCR